MKYLIIIFFTLFIIACQKDNEILPETNNIIECIGLVQEFNSLTNCDETEISEHHCDIVDIGSFEIKEESKLFFPQFCNSEGQEIEYLNESGQSKIFILKSKSYNKSRLLLTSNKTCDSISDETIGFCIDNETIMFELENISDSIRFVLSISTIPDIYSESNMGNVGDRLKILRDLGPVFFEEFDVIINQRTLTYDKTVRQEFYDSIEILDENFKNVISKNISGFSTTIFKYYFNSEFGLFAFIDDQGVIWKKK